MISGKTSLNNKFSRIMVYSNSTKYSTQHTSQNKNKTKNPQNNPQKQYPNPNFSNKWTALTLAHPRLLGLQLPLPGYPMWSAPHPTTLWGYLKYHRSSPVTPPNVCANLCVYLCQFTCLLILDIMRNCLWIIRVEHSPGSCWSHYWGFFLRGRGGF